MAKRKFMTPLLLSGGLTPGSDPDDPIIGDGSVQSGFEAYPCDFEEWLTMFADGTDYDGDEEPDTFEDWKVWMDQHGFDWTDYAQE